MKQRVISFITVLCLMLSMVPQTVFAATVVADGVCGENLSWELSDDHVLTISGTGAMEDYPDNTAPWYEYRQSVNAIIIEDGVEYIGVEAFLGCEYAESATIASSVREIGKNAFDGCTALRSAYMFDLEAWCKIHFHNKWANPLGAIGGQLFLNGENLEEVVIPEGIENLVYAFDGAIEMKRLILPSSMTYVGSTPSRLEKIIFLGDAPEFSYNTVQTVTADAFYPEDNETWTEDIRQNYRGEITWRSW